MIRIGDKEWNRRFAIRWKLFLFTLIAVLLMFFSIRQCIQNYKDRAACQECVESFSSREIGELACCAGYYKFVAADGDITFPPYSACLRIECDWGN